MNPNIPDDDKLVITEGDFPPRTKVLVVDYILNLHKKLKDANDLVKEARSELDSWESNAFEGCPTYRSCSPECIKTRELLDRMDVFLDTMNTPNAPVWKEGVTPPNSTLQ